MTQLEKQLIKYKRKILYLDVSCRDLVRVHTRRVQEKNKFHLKIKNSHFIIEKLPFLGFVTTAVHCVYYFAPPFSYKSMNTRIMRNFEGVGSKNDFLITRHLSSGRVRRTRHQISAGADAPVAPALTRSLRYIHRYKIDK